MMGENRFEDTVKIEKAIEHINDRLRYACVSTAIDVDVVRMSVQALEKQVPKEVVRERVTIKTCPSCDSVVNKNYCPNCGQKLKY